MRRSVTTAIAAIAVTFSFEAQAQPHPEMIIQYFETSWAEVTARIPEIAAAGYTAIWLPPPTKGAEGTADVGFSVYDRFDLGDRDQRGTIATKYGTKEEAKQLVREAHRFGLKVYFDTVMNHNANPGKIENANVTLDPARIEEFPGTTPLDYHVLPARDVGNGNFEVKNPGIFGGNVYTLAPNFGVNEQFVPVTPMPAGVNIPGFTHLARAPWIDFSNAGLNEVQLLSLLGLIDFALEQDVTPNGPAASDGMNKVAEQPLPRIIRFPDRVETYPNNTPVPEDIREFMMRWIRWFGDETDCDGLRLDAIKHVPTQFFARDFANDPIDFNGAFQSNFDQRRGYSDANDDDGEQDALLFGESFTGSTDELQPYRNTGMFLLDFPLLFRMANDGGVFARNGDGDIGQLSFPQGGLTGGFTEFGGLGRNSGVAFVQSHDTDAPAAQADAAYAFITTRVGHSVVFFDGNNFNTDTFVKKGRIDALGELGSNTITSMLDIRRRFARGGMFNRFVDGDFYVYERVVPTSNGTGGATLLVAITDSTQSEGRFGEFDSRPLLVTEFAPGTVLVELTGNGATPEVTVLAQNAVPQDQLNRALAAYDLASDFPPPPSHGLVYLQVPAGPANGYVMYAPKTPALEVRLSSNATALPRTSIETAPARRTPAGAPIPPAELDAAALAVGQKLTITAVSDGVAANVYVMIDSPSVAIPGLSQVTGTSEKLYDGFHQLPRASGNNYEAAELDLSSLPGGVHLITVRAATGGTPSFFREARQYVFIGAEPAPDGGVIDVDGGAIDPDGGVIMPPDAGEMSDLDPDRDGINNENDVCPDIADPDQLDFDGDGAGDACDDCAETASGVSVDDHGCPAVDPALASRLEAIISAILSRQFDGALDENGDGAIDAVDFAIAAKGGTP